MLCSGEMTSSQELLGCAKRSFELRTARYIELKSRCGADSRNETLWNGGMGRRNPVTNDAMSALPPKADVCSAKPHVR